MDWGRGGGSGGGGGGVGGVGDVVFVDGGVEVEGEVEGGFRLEEGC